LNNDNQSVRRSDIDEQDHCDNGFIQLSFDFGELFYNQKINLADPFIPCPQRGTHSRLTDCWMCFTDVDADRIALRDAVAEPQVGPDKLAS